MSNEITNGITKYAILWWIDKIFYLQELASLCQVQAKLKTCRKSKESFLSSYFIADDSHIKIVWLYQGSGKEKDGNPGKIIGSNLVMFC